MSQALPGTAVAVPRGQITGRKVLVGLLAFFGVVFAVNGTFVYFAFASWPGLSADRPYGHGLQYNAVLAAADAQAAQGWHSSLTQQTVGGQVRFQVVLRNANGDPVSGAAARLDLERPIGEIAGAALPLAEWAPGAYRADASKLPAGRWYATLTATAPGAADYRLRYEIQVRP